jgi:hypothetical protein
MISSKRTARVAGLLYLAVIPLGIFGALYVPSRLIVPGDPAATAANILASESLFRLGIVSDLLAAIVMLLVVLTLHRLIKPVNKNIALLMVIFFLVGVPVTMLNKLNQFAALQLLSGPDYLTVFTTEELQALTFLFLRLQSRGSEIAFVFWGLWLFPLGYLVIKSGFLPRILGVLLIVAGSGYVIESFASFLGFRVSIGLFAAWGEVIFLFWLLIKGVNIEQWEKRALNST